MAFPELLSAPALSPGVPSHFTTLSSVTGEQTAKGSSLQQLTHGDRKENIDQGAGTHISSRYDKCSLSLTLPIQKCVQPSHE